MALTRFRIGYVGCGLAGRSSSCAWVMRRAGASYVNLRGDVGQQPILWTSDNREVELELGISHARAIYARPAQEMVGRLLDAELEWLAQADGVVFVADSHSMRVGPSVEQWELLRTELRAKGRDPESVPTVIQLNKRDLPEAIRAELLVRHFEAHRGPFVETIANKGIGVAEAIDKLVAMMLRFEL